MKIAGRFASISGCALLSSGSSPALAQPGCPTLSTTPPDAARRHLLAIILVCGFSSAAQAQQTLTCPPGTNPTWLISIAGSPEISDDACHQQLKAELFPSFEATVAAAEACHPTGKRLDLGYEYPNGQYLAWKPFSFFYYDHFAKWASAYYADGSPVLHKAHEGQADFYYRGFCQAPCPCNQDRSGSSSCVPKAKNPWIDERPDGEIWFYEYHENNEGLLCPPVEVTQKKCEGEGPDGSLGNPVQCNTGVKTHSETDYSGSGAGALSFSRSYSSDEPDPWQATPGPTLELKTVFGFQLATVARGNDLRVVFIQKNGVWEGQLGEGETLTQSAGEWRFTSASGTVWIFDSAGQFTSEAPIGSPGRTVLRAPGVGGAYSETITNAFGRSLRLDYAANGKLQTLTDPAGQTYHYAYDVHGNLVKVTYPDETPADSTDNPTKQYLYEDSRFPHALTGIVDENGDRYATYAYDAQGRAILSEHAGGAEKFTFDYQTPDQTLVRQWSDDARYQEKLYRHARIAGADRVIGITDLACPTCAGNGEEERWFYDADGNLDSTTDHNGVATEYSHDGRGNQISRTEAKATAQERTVTTIWHPSLGLPSEMVGPGRTTTYTYDTNGNRLSETITDTATGESRTTTWTYTASGLVDTVDGPRSDVADVTDHDYDTQGNLIRVTNALGQTTEIPDHDAHGNPTRIVDANGVETLLVYDARQRLKTRTVAGATTSFDYDGVGQLKKVTLPDASFLQYSYDPAHRLIGVRDSQGNSIAYALDAAGNRTKEEVIDPANALRRTQSQVFDTLGRLKEIRGANGQVTDFGYDAQGNRTRQTEAGSFHTANAYDALNRVKQVTDAADGITQYGYNALDQLESVTDPKDLTTTYRYNALGDLKQQASPDTGTTSYTYDAAGNRKTQLDARGIEVTYSYDALNRLKLVDYPGLAEDVSYTYDGNNYSPAGQNGIGRLTGITDESGETTLFYDARGNVTHEKRLMAGTTYATSYAYDAADRLASVTYPSGRQVSYERDALGRIGRVTTTVDGVTSTLADGIEYLPFGPMKKYILGNGVVVERQHDQDYRIARYTAAGTNPIQEVELFYDLRNNIEATLDTIDAGRSQTFGYDALSRLTAAEGFYGKQGFAYDGVGNRLRQTVIPAEAGAQSEDTYAYAPDSHRLLSVSGANPQTFAYDNAGNVIQKGNLTLTYNSAGRFSEAVIPAQAGIQFAYNAAGQRVRKDIGDARTVFHYDRSGRLIAETDDSGEALREYIWLGEQPIAVLTPVIPDPPEQVLDNPQATFVGKWHRVLQPIGFEGADCQRHPKAPPKQASATWTPLLTKPAKYEVFAKWSAHPDRATDAPYTIHDKDGQTTVRMDQTRNNGVWVSLGAFNLVPGSTIMLENSSNGQVLADAIRIVRISGGNVTGTHYFLTDHLNTPQAATNQDQAIVWQATYEPFGKVSLFTEEVPNPLRFPGQYFDAETGLHQNWHRDYDPSIGRYLQSDPIELSGGISTYGYVGGNPITLADFSGLIPQGTWIEGTPSVNIDPKPRFSNLQIGWYGVDAFGFVNVVSFDATLNGRLKIAVHCKDDETCKEWDVRNEIPLSLTGSIHTGPNIFGTLAGGLGGITAAAAINLALADLRALHALEQLMQSHGAMAAVMRQEFLDRGPNAICRSSAP